MSSLVNNQAGGDVQFAYLSQLYREPCHISLDELKAMRSLRKVLANHKLISRFEGKTCK
jgi:hypothetical protein